MAFPVLARTISAALCEPDHQVVEFIWHGGETTVLPIDFYKKAMMVQSRFRRHDQVVHNSIQTNGTRLTPTWVRFLRDHEFTVGVSLDGPPELHDRCRRTLSGQGSFDDVARGIHLLQRFGVPFTVLMVVDDAALELGPDRVFDFFLALGVTHFSAIAAKPANQPYATSGTQTTHYADPIRMTGFLSRLYDRWCEHGDPKILIRELHAIRNRLAGGRPGICTLGGGCLGRYFLVEPNGEIAHCDLFLGDSRYSLGNVMQHSFGDIRKSAALHSLQAENRRALDQLSRCPEFGVCNGWCPHERYLSVRHNPHHRADCCGLRALITHIRIRIGQERRGGCPPLPLSSD
jgi:uncharacterized protein